MTRRGAVLLEAVIVLVLCGIGVGSLMWTFTASSDLVGVCRAELRAASEHRRGLERLANLLRAVDPTTASNFGPAAPGHPNFERVVAFDASAEGTLSGVESLEWRASTQPVQGVTSPGGVWHVRAGGDVLAAARVPEGGFLVELDGGAITLHLTTYYVVGDTVRTMSTTTMIQTRNEP